MDLLLNHTNDHDKARLLAALAEYNADWLNTLPIISSGLRLDNKAVRVMVSLRLDVNICQPHTYTSVELHLTKKDHMHYYLNGVMQNGTSK